MVTSNLFCGGDSEKLTMLGKLAGASARIIAKIPDMDASSNQYRILKTIIDRLDEVAVELER